MRRYAWLLLGAFSILFLLRLVRDMITVYFLRFFNIADQVPKWGVSIGDLTYHESHLLLARYT